MADNDLKVIVKAKELAVHSFKLTSNCNRYPKKYRHSLVDRIQLKSLDIYDTLFEANRINNVTNKRDRCEAITKAISSYAYFTTRVSIRGATGAAGAAGSDATVTKENIEAALGYTPANADDIPAGGDSIPDYVRTEAERVAKVVQSRQNANTITFLACSDIHYSSPDNASPITTAENIKEATTHMGQAMGIIREHVHIDFAAMLGDMVRDNGEADSDEIQAEVRFVNSCLHDGFAGIPVFRAEGNHDEAYESGVGLSADQVFANIHAWNTGATYGDRAAGYCYRDFEGVKLRVICLNSSEVSGSSMCLSAAQVSWLAEVLDLSEKEDDWCSLILSHHPLDFSRNGGVDPATTINAATGLIGTVHGHIHNFVVGDITGTEVKRIAIPNAVRDQENSYASTAIYDEGTKYTKTAGTAEDTSFCVVTIDLAARKIYADHYGAGYSREIDYTYKAPSGGYTNLVPTSIDPSSGAVYGVDYNGDGTADGYKNDVYGSGDGEGSSADTDCVLTGLIAYGNDVETPIYIMGADITTASHCRILGFDSNRSCYFQAAAGSAISTYFTVEVLDADRKYYKVTPIRSAITGQTDYLRFSLINADGGANLIVTIGEPIA